MTLNELMTLLEQNPELKEQFNKSKESLSSEQRKDPKSLSKVLSELGYEVPESEFFLTEIVNKEIDVDELESVGGGKKILKYGDPCSNDYQDTDCWLDDYCDVIVNIYKSRPECYQDYRDMNCVLMDHCNSGWNSY